MSFEEVVHLLERHLLLQQDLNLSLSTKHNFLLFSNPIYTLGQWTNNNTRPHTVT